MSVSFALRSLGRSRSVARCSVVTGTEALYQSAERVTVDGKHQELSILEVLHAYVEEHTRRAIRIQNGTDTIGDQTAYGHGVEQTLPCGRLRPEFGTKPFAFEACTGEILQD